MKQHSSAYNTTATKGFKIEEIRTRLKAAKINTYYPSVDGYNIKKLIGQDTYSMNVPAFTHPLVIAEGDSELWIDLRPFVNVDRTGVEKITSIRDYEVLCDTARLSIIMEANDSWLKNISTLPPTVFASWIAETFQKRFGLNPKEQYDIMILSTVYYFKLFEDNDIVTDKTKEQLITRLSRTLRLNAEDVQAIVEEYSYVSNLESFANAIIGINGTVRLQELNPGLMMTMFNTSWFGYNSKEKLAVALEHIPTFIAILKDICIDRSASKTTLGQIVNRGGNQKLVPDFLVNFDKMINSNKG